MDGDAAGCCAGAHIDAVDFDIPAAASNRNRVGARRE